MKNMFVFCIVLTLCIQISLQCFCPFTGQTENVAGAIVPATLCHSPSNIQYVVAKIVSKTDTANCVTGDMRFDVKIFKILSKSGVEIFKRGRPDSLFAPVASSMCSYIDFPIGQKFYVGVMRVYGQYRFNGCSFGRNAYQVTNVEKKIMTGEISCPK